MLKIRLRRMGSTHRPFYRVVVSDSRLTPTASAIEEIGYYDPRKDPSVIKIDTDRVEHWTSRGAQLSDAVKKLVKQQATGVVGSFSSASTTAEKTQAAPAPAAEEKPESADSTEAATAEPEKAAEAAAEPKAEAAAEPKAEAAAEPKAEAAAEPKAEEAAEKTAEETTEAASA